MADKKNDQAPGKIGLHHHQDVVVKQDSEGLRGQLKQVRHLVEVTPVEE